MIDRRKFLTSTGLATASLAIPSILTPRKVGAVTIDPNVFINTGKSIAQVAAKHFYGTITPTDYKNLSNTYNTLAYFWAGYGMDNMIKPYYNGVNENQLTAAYVRVSAAAATVRLYNPSVTNQTVSAYLNWFASSGQAISGGVDYRTVTLNNMRANGMYPYIIKARNQCSNIAAMLTPKPVYFQGKYYQPQPLVVQKAPQNPPINENGPSPSECQWDAFDSYAAGLGFFVLSVMTGGLADLGIAGVLAAGILTDIGIAGTLGSFAWGIGHGMVCPL
jgi:hypothetical protein